MEALQSKMNDINPIGRRIVSQRTIKGITQDQMSKIFNITQTNYGRLERDDSRLTIHRLMAICKKLKVSLNYLVYGDDTPSNNLIKKTHKENGRNNLR